MNTIKNDKKFHLEIKQIEHDAIIECMKIEIEILEAKLIQASAIKQKLLHDCDCSNFGEVIFKKYGRSYMKTHTNLNYIKKTKDIPSVVCTLRIVPTLLLGGSLIRMSMQILSYLFCLPIGGGLIPYNKSKLK